MTQAVFRIEPDPAPITTVGFDTWLNGEHGETRWQLLAGRIVGMVTPTIAHARISNNLGDALAL